MVKVREHNYKFISARPFAPNLGAEVYGVDLSKPISEEQFLDIYKAFLDHQVLFFKDQKEIPPARHIAFGKRFGELHLHPAAPTMKGHPEIFEIHANKNSKVANGEFWHFVADGGYRNEEHWCDDGWAWRTHRNMKWPFFWQPCGPGGSNEYSLRTIFEVVPMQWDW